MKKLWAIVKREYFQRVRAKMFIATTIMLPTAMILFGVVPALILNYDAGTPLRLVIVDETGRMSQRLRKAATDGEKARQEQAEDPMARRTDVNRLRAARFDLEELPLNGRSQSEIRDQLDRRMSEKEIDGYLILPRDLMQNGKVQFFRRNTGDYLTTRGVEDIVERAVAEQRLIDANVDANTRTELGRPVDFQTTRISASGEERDSGGAFALVFGVGFIMYLTVLLYGQVVLGSVIAEKETHIAEVLFSSVKPFTLMMGKLLGVSLLALTQLTIWTLAFGAFAFYGVNLLASRGVPSRLPHVAPIYIVYFALFFLLGYFVYATLYALVGSIVTTPQEGGQLAMPIILMLVISFYLFLPVSRNPDAPFAFWLSITPFFAPVTMMVRIVTQTPPFWEIATSLLIGFGTVVFFVWIASRIYRVGMLMYGKRASLREVIHWVSQS